MTQSRRSAHWKKALLAFALSSLGAMAFAQAASATHESPVGASPLRVSMVPAFAPCGGGINSAHNPPLAFPSCSPPVPISTVARWGPSSIGFARIVVCIPPGAGFCAPAPAGSLPLPDDRVTGNILDVVCSGVSPGCPGAGAPYNPNGGGPYTTAGGAASAPTPACLPTTPGAPAACLAGQDMTLTATIPGDAPGTAIRISDHNNSVNPATVVDLPFPIPVDCFPAAPAGSACGTNTTANAVVAGAVVTGTVADVEIGQAQFRDAGLDGVTGNADDSTFAVQGIVNP